MSNERIFKPPLGAMPAYLSATRRIIELAKAIDRTAADYSDGSECRMKNWAKEIILQCDILSNFPSGSPGQETEINIPASLFHAFNAQTPIERNSNELQRTINAAGKANEQRFKNNIEDGDTLA